MTELKTNDTAPAETTTLRFLIDHPQTGWQLYPLQKALLALKGDLAIPEYADQDLRVVFAHIAVTGDEPIRLERLEFALWQIDKEGHVEPHEELRGIVERINPVAGDIEFTLVSSLPVTDVDITAVMRCLGILDKL